MVDVGLVVGFQGLPRLGGGASVGAGVGAGMCWVIPDGAQLFPLSDFEGFQGLPRIFLCDWIRGRSKP